MLWKRKERTEEGQKPYENPWKRLDPYLSANDKSFLSLYRIGPGIFTIQEGLGLVVQESDVQNEIARNILLLGLSTKVTLVKNR